MKKLTNISFLMLAFLLIFPWPVRAERNKSVPCLVLEEEEVDVGNVREGSQVSHGFRVLNQGKAPLEIRKVSPG